MRCLSCHLLSLKPICDRCKQALLVPSVSRRKIGTLEVVSLFGYEHLERYLLTKHTPIGYRVYKYFGQEFMAPFLQDFSYNQNDQITLLAIDERVDSGYSHTALLSHYAKSKKISRAHSVLFSKNPVKYAGKTLQYRIENPRNFVYTGKHNISVILIDDIVTTGMTLSEASTILKKQEVDVLFALTLADANR